MSLDALRAELRVSDIALIDRVENDAGVLKLVVKGKTQISGVVLDQTYLSSFALFLSVFAGRVSALDLPLVKRDYPAFAWVAWTAHTLFLKLPFSGAWEFASLCKI